MNQAEFIQNCRTIAKETKQKQDEEYLETIQNKIKNMLPTLLNTIQENAKKGETSGIIDRHSLDLSIKDLYFLCHSTMCDRARLDNYFDNEIKFSISSGIVIHSNKNQEFVDNIFYTIGD